MDTITLTSVLKKEPEGSIAPGLVLRMPDTEHELSRLGGQEGGQSMLSGGISQSEALKEPTSSCVLN